LPQSTPRLDGLRKWLAQHKAGVVEALILAAIYVFHIVTTWVWLGMDNRVLFTDSANKYEMSLRMFRSFSQDVLISDPGTWLAPFLVPGKFGYGAWPPLPDLALMPFYAVFGAEPDTAVLAHYVVFFLFLVVLVYLIGRRLFGARAGLLELSL